MHGESTDCVMGGELLRTYEIILRVYYEEHPEEKKLNNADKGAD